MKWNYFHLFCAQFGLKVDFYYLLFHLRYNAIIHPLREISTPLEWLRNNKWFSISSIWLGGVCIGGAQLIYSRAVPFTYGEQTLYDCREVWDEHWGKIYTIVIFVATFALPLSILVFVYSTIGYHVWRHVIPGNPDKQRDVSRGNRKDKVCYLKLVF